MDQICDNEGSHDGRTEFLVVMFPDGPGQSR